MSYEELKTYLTENKQKFVLLICFVLTFIVGFGTGRVEQVFRKPERRSQTNANHTQNSNQKPAAAGNQTVKSPAAGAQAGDCPIKGNISATSKIYHIPGGSFYARTTPEQCFKTEAEAKAAGFRKSSR